MLIEGSSTSIVVVVILTGVYSPSPTFAFFHRTSYIIHRTLLTQAKVIINLLHRAIAKSNDKNVSFMEV